MPLRLYLVCVRGIYPFDVAVNIIIIIIKFCHVDQKHNRFLWFKNIFITGATGLLGKSIIEKLLWVYRGIKCIYVLIRPKRGVSVAERLENLISSEVS